MRYRVRVDLGFPEEADARALWEHAKALAAKATSLNEGAANEEVSYGELEICRHDEGQPCLRQERIEIRKQG